MHGDWLNGLLPWEAGAGIVLIFLAAATVVTFCVSLWSGWRLLSERYRSEREFAGERWRFQSGRMRWGCGYNNCLTLGANAEGLYMAVLPVILPWHPPLFIPWIEITTREERRWWGYATVFTLGREMQIPLRVLKRVGDELRRDAPFPAQSQNEA
jgi:hypothetical protein